jgi:hypothetical protein
MEIKTTIIRGTKITTTFWHDDDAESPREWGPNTQLQIDLGRNGPTIYEERKPGFRKFAVRAHVHGSIDLTLDNGGCVWDSGLVGSIYAIDEKSAAQDLEILTQWLNGDVWGYTIEDEDGKIFESCGGFYGFEDVERCAQEELDNLGSGPVSDREHADFLMGQIAEVLR